MAEDKELAAIRSRRMQEMQEQQQKNEDAKVNQEMMLNNILNQVLDQQARARLNIISVAKPAKGKELESIIAQMATSGQIAGRLKESDLVSLLETINARTQKVTTVKFDRRRAAIDSDSD